MAAKYDGGPAFPFPAFEVQSEVFEDTFVSKGSYGMTLRDYFAAHALAGMTACRDQDGHFFPPDVIAASAWAHADAMIAARKS